MSAPVKLDDLIDAMQWHSDEAQHFLNKKTGEVVFINDEEFQAAEKNNPLEDYPDWQRENIRIAKEIMESGDYLELPDQFEMNEYRIMEDFCFSVEDLAIRNELLNAIGGKGTFRRFKNILHRYGLQDQWYKYKDDAYKKEAIGWCEVNDIPYQTEEKNDA